MRWRPAAARARTAMVVGWSLPGEGWLLAGGCGAPREVARGPSGSQVGRKEGCRAEEKVRNSP